MKRRREKKRGESEEEEEAQRGRGDAPNEAPPFLHLHLPNGFEEGYPSLVLVIVRAYTVRDLSLHFLCLASYRCIFLSPHIPIKRALSIEIFGSPVVRVVMGFFYQSRCIEVFFN